MSRIIGNRIDNIIKLGTEELLEEKKRALAERRAEMEREEKEAIELEEKLKAEKIEAENALKAMAAQNYTKTIPFGTKTKDIDSEAFRDEEEKGFWGRQLDWIKGHMPFMQALILFSLLSLFVAGFKLYERKINDFNAGLTDEQMVSEKINAFNDANLQRIIFERILQVSDLIMMFLFIMIVVPSVFTYVIPFVKSPKDFYCEFFEELSPWQRTLSFLILISALLVYFGLGHAVNTY